VYSSGKLIAEYSNVTPTATPTTSYTTSDRLGSPRVITDATGQVKSRRDFMPFGENLNVGVGARNNLTHKYGSNEDNIRQKFTGYLKDNETNLDFAEARYYSNNHGRFTAVDPLLASGKSANPQTFNRYVYCLNNPVNCTDPTGLDGVWGYRDINGGTQLQFFESQSALDTFNNSQTGCENSICPNYTLYTGGNFFLWADRSVSYLGGDGKEFVFNFSVPDDREIDQGLWDGIAGSFQNRSFTGEQTTILTARMKNEQIIADTRKQLDDAIEKIEKRLDGNCESGEVTCLGVSIKSVKQAVGGIYALLDKAGKIVRSGRTVDLVRRAAEHKRDPILKKFEFSILHKTNDYATQRGLEQIVHQLKSPIYNKIRGISPTNPKRAEYLEAATKFLTNQK
jgi:RHS repeat-associated protein